MLKSSHVNKVIDPFCVSRVGVVPAADFDYGATSSGQDHLYPAGQFSGHGDQHEYEFRAAVLREQGRRA